MMHHDFVWLPIPADSCVVFVEYCLMNSGQQQLEKIEIPKFPRTCASEIFLLGQRSVRPQGVRAVGRIPLEKIADFRETQLNL
jgi:hypothetical protein